MSRPVESNQGLNDLGRNREVTTKVEDKTETGNLKEVQDPLAEDL